MKVAIGAVLIACVALLAIWPPFLMPRELYQLIYGWRYPIVRDCGDGTLTDRGPGASSDRYAVDYGYLPVDMEIERTFRLCSLPRDWMVLGLEYELQEGERSHVEAAQLSEVRIHNVQVRASISEQEGERTIVAHDGLLGYDWIWNHGAPLRPPFLYATDTMFAPKPGKTYELRIVVMPGSSSPDAQVRLLVKGGGWKGAPPPSDSSVETLRDLPTTGRY